MCLDTTVNRRVMTSFFIYEHVPEDAPVAPSIAAKEAKRLLRHCARVCVHCGLISGSSVDEQLSTRPHLLTPKQFHLR